MGKLQDISLDNSITLLFTNSGKAEMYVYDRIKECCSATRESVYEVGTKRDFMDMLELVNLQPFLAEKWIFILDYKKAVKSMCKTNKGVLHAETSCFLVKVYNYADYKEFKSLYPTCNDLYLARLNPRDISYIFNGYNLSQKVVDFISSSYGSDVDKVFDIKEALDNGEEINSNKDIVKLVGASGGSVSKLALQLLNEPPKLKGRDRVLKARLNAIVALCDTYNISTVRNYLLASVKDILDIKVLYLQGIIFKRISKLPEKYDEKRLSKYQYCINSITEEIPYARILRLYTTLMVSGVWKEKIDILTFLYSYYSDDNLREDK